jgi:hypothetical protein
MRSTTACRERCNVSRCVDSATNPGSTSMLALFHRLQRKTRAFFDGRLLHRFHARRGGKRSINIRHWRAKSSTTAKMRKRRQWVKAMETKSSDQRRFGASGERTWGRCLRYACVHRAARDVTKVLEFDAARFRLNTHRQGRLCASQRRSGV